MTNRISIMSSWLFVHLPQAAPPVDSGSLGHYLTTMTSQRTKHMLCQCCASVIDAGPTLTQNCVSYLLGLLTLVVLHVIGTGSTGSRSFIIPLPSCEYSTWVIWVNYWSAIVTPRNLTLQEIVSRCGDHQLSFLDIFWSIF